MGDSKQSQCSILAKQVIADLQNPKSSISAIIRKLELLASLAQDKELAKWCDLQFGKYAGRLPYQDDKEEYSEYLLKRLLPVVKKYELVSILSSIETRAHLRSMSIGFGNIETAEALLRDMDRLKESEVAGVHKIAIIELINRTKNEAAERINKLYLFFCFGDIPVQIFDRVRDRVDYLLLEICPDAIEKFMAAYQNLSNYSPENWSLALTSCRRVIKSVADVLEPSSTEAYNNRAVGEDQYINRLWKFLDKNAKGGSDKELAKAHIDHLGTFLKKLNDKSCKGVHSDVAYDEAAKAVLYTYLTLGDILEFSSSAVSAAVNAKKETVSINSATVDELLSGGFNMTQAKAIVRRRTQCAIESLDELKAIKGIGTATVRRLKTKFTTI